MVCCINYTGKQTCLLEEANLNLEPAMQLVIAVEAATKDSHVLHLWVISVDVVGTTNFVELRRRDVAGMAVLRVAASNKHPNASPIPALVSSGGSRYTAQGYTELRELTPK